MATENPRYLPDRVTAARQLFRACEVHKKLKEKQADLPNQPESTRAALGQTILDTMRGVDTIIVARFQDLDRQGDKQVGQMILRNTLGRRPKPLQPGENGRERP